MDVSILNVNELPKADRVEENDTLLVVRQNSDGTQSCYRVDGAQFSGEDAYTVAVRQGFTGSYAEWAAQVGRVSSTTISFDAATGEIIIKSQTNK